MECRKNKASPSIIKKNTTQKKKHTACSLNNLLSAIRPYQIKCFFSFVVQLTPNMNLKFAKKKEKVEGHLKE